MHEVKVESAVAETIAKTFHSNVPVTRETVSEDIDGWDSVSHLLLILALEERFSVDLSEYAFDLKNVGELIDLIEDARNREQRD